MVPKLRGEVLLCAEKLVFHALIVAKCALKDDDSNFADDLIRSALKVRQIFKDALNGPSDGPNAIDLVYKLNLAIGTLNGLQDISTIGYKREIEKSKLVEFSNIQSTLLAQVSRLYSEVSDGVMLPYT